jgi:hypothetical protein
MKVLSQANLDSEREHIIRTLLIYTYPTESIRLKNGEEFSQKKKEKKRKRKRKVGTRKVIELTWKIDERIIERIT